MPYYDDRDYFYSADDIDELYDEHEEDPEETEYANEREFDCYYHTIANELVDD